MASGDEPLPYGWTMEVDVNTNHPYWVDTQANPPRSIWVHPYQDEQYLSEHPELRERLIDPNSHYLYNPPEISFPQSYPYHAPSNQDMPRGACVPHLRCPNTHKKGFFGKLKDRATGKFETPRGDLEADRRLQAQMQERSHQLQQAAQDVFEERSTARGAGLRPSIYLAPGDNPYTYRAGNGEYRG